MHMSSLQCAPSEVHTQACLYEVIHLTHKFIISVSGFVALDSWLRFLSILEFPVSTRKMRGACICVPVTTTVRLLINIY